MGEHGAPSECGGQSPVTLTAVREAPGKINLHANGKKCSNPGAEPPSEVRQVQVGSTQTRGVPTKIVTVLSFLQNKITGAYQNPVRSKADRLLEELHNHLIHLCQDMLNCIKMFRAEIKALL